MTTHPGQFEPPDSTIHGPTPSRPLRIAAPFLLLAAFAGREGAAGGIALAVTIPFMYAVGGFIGGIIAAALYDLVAKWTGGLEFEVSDDTSVAQ